MKQAKRNKPYRPRHRSRFGGLAAIERTQLNSPLPLPMAADQVTDIGLAAWMALDIMLTGDSAEEHWGTIVCALNIGLVLAERGFSPEHEQTIIAALDGAFRAHVRAQQTGAWRFDGSSIAPIKQALSAHDQQVQAVNRQDMRAALQEVHRRIKQGNVYTTAGEAIPATLQGEPA